MSQTATRGTLSHRRDRRRHLPKAQSNSKSEDVPLQPLQPKLGDLADDQQDLQNTATMNHQSRPGQTGTLEGPQVPAAHDTQHSTIEASSPPDTGASGAQSINPTLGVHPPVRPAPGVPTNTSQQAGSQTIGPNNPLNIHTIALPMQPTVSQTAQSSTPWYRHRWSERIAVITALIALSLAFISLVYQAWSGRNDALQACLAAAQMNMTSAYCDSVIAKGVKAPPFGKRVRDLSFVINKSQFWQRMINIKKCLSGRSPQMCTLPSAPWLIGYATIYIICVVPQMYGFWTRSLSEHFAVSIKTNCLGFLTTVLLLYIGQMGK